MCDYDTADKLYHQINRLARECELRYLDKSRVRFAVTECEAETLAWNYLYRCRHDRGPVLGQLFGITIVVEGPPSSAKSTAELDRIKWGAAR